MGNELAKTGFDLQVNTVGEARQLAEMMANSQLAPKDYKGKPDDTLIAMMMGSEIGLNPMQAIQNIAVINGRPAIWGDAMLALVQNHPSFKSIEESFDDNAMTAKCVVVRKGGKPHTSTFSRADAELAGLWGRNTWKQYPKRMLAMRARGFALRNQFADALLGLISAEEAQDIPQDVVNDSPAETSVGVIEHTTLPEYTDEQFKESVAGFEAAINAGKKTAQGIIDMVSTKYVLTEKQEATILDLGESA